MTRIDKADKVLGNIGLHLKELRILSGYSSYETFAIEHDLSRRYYWAAEKGTNLSLKYLIKILEIHKITIQEFFNTMENKS